MLRRNHMRIKKIRPRKYRLLNCVGLICCALLQGCGGSAGSAPSVTSNRATNIQNGAQLAPELPEESVELPREEDESIEQPSAPLNPEPELGQPPSQSQPVVTTPVVPPPPDDANVIIKEIYRITEGYYEIPSFQLRQIERAEEPEKVAEWLEERISSLQQKAAMALGIKANDLTVIEVLPTLNLEFAVRSYGDISRESFLYRLGAEAAYEMGFKIATLNLDQGAITFPEDYVEAPVELSAEHLSYPVVAEILRLTNGTYRFSSQELREVNMAEDPQQVADWLEERVISYQQRGAEALGVSPLHLSPRFLLPSMWLGSAVKSYGPISTKGYLTSLGPRKSFEVGYHKGRGDW